jgi:hypothetical protein
MAVLSSSVSYGHFQLIILVFRRTFNAKNFSSRSPQWQYRKAYHTRFCVYVCIAKVDISSCLRVVLTSVVEPSFLAKSNDETRMNRLWENTLVELRDEEDIDELADGVPSL